MKKILISIMIIAVVAALAVGGTVAYFQTANDNVTASFDTATVSLNAYGEANNNVIFDVSNMIPGQSVAKYLYVKNTSAVPLHVTAALNKTGDTALDQAFSYKLSDLNGAVNEGDGYFLVAAGATAYVKVTVTFEDTKAIQDLQGKSITYTASVYGVTSKP